VEPLVRLIHHLGTSPPSATGAWTYGCARGARGLVFLEGGRVCWAAAPHQQRRLTDLIEQAVGISREEVTRVVMHCRREGEPLGESLVREGLVSPEQFQRVLERHTCESLWHIAREAQLEQSFFTPHRGRGYSPRFTLSLARAFTSTMAIAMDLDLSPVVHRLDQDLEGGGRGAIFSSRANGSLVPVAQVGGEFSGLDELLNLGAWAESALGIVSRLWPRNGAICALIAGGGVAAWREEDYPVATFFERDVELHRLLSRRARLSG
jgi:hypothetical protein